MSTRSYQQACSVARFLDLLGTRWTLLLVRDLLAAPRRFKELLANAPAMGPNLLTQRLRELTELGIVEKSGTTYRLTAAGRELEPVIVGMARWSLAHLTIDPDNPGTTRPDLLVVALRAVFNAGAAAGLTESYELRVGETTIGIELENGELHTRLGATDDPAFVWTSSSETFDRIGGGALGIEEAEEKGLVTIEGSRRAFKRFQAVFAGS